MANKLKRDEQDKQSHYALRKISKDLISVSAGLVFAGMVSEKQVNQVKAASLPDNSRVSQIKSNQEIVEFGKIIPVNQDMQPIANAPTPQYRRDPEDPNKAIATPIPDIKDYKLADKEQAENVDLETKMVFPPANVQEDTKIIYVESIKPQQPNPAKPVIPNNSANQNHLQPSRPAVNNKPTVSNANSSANTNKNYLGNITHAAVQSNPNNQSNSVQNTTYQVNSSVTYSNNINNSNFSNQQSSDQGSSLNMASQTSEANPSNSAGSEDTKIDKKKTKNKTKKSKASAKQKLKTEHKKHSTPKTKPKAKKQPSKQFMVMPQVIMNPETKLPPKPQKATLVLADAQDKKELLRLEAYGSQGAPIEFEEWNRTLTSLQEKGYELAGILDVNQEKKRDLHAQFIFGFYGEKESSFVASFAHKLVAVTANNLPSNISASLVKHAVSLVVRYQGAGDNTPEENVQNAVFTRSLTMDKVTHRLIKDGKFTTPWHSQPLSYQEVVSPKVNGFVADPTLVPKMAVASEDVIKTVVYKPVAQKTSEIKKTKQTSNAEEITVVKPVPKVSEVKKQKQQNLKPVTFYPKKKQKIETKLISDPKKQEQTPEKEKKMTLKQEHKTVSPKSDLVECHFIDQNGKSIRQETKLNASGVLPAIDGYYLVKTELNTAGMTAAYAPMAKIVPVDQYGNLIPEPLDPTKAVAPVAFKADPNDPTKAAKRQKVLQISGWSPAVATVSPENNKIDIPVVYTRIKK